MPEVARFLERRAHPRQKSTVPAFIERHRADSFSCRVFDLSANSARIAANDIALPDSFVLVLKLRWNMRRNCKVVWRNGYVAAVQFVAWRAAQTEASTQ